MKTTFAYLIALAALCASVCFAADLDGKWVAQVQGRNGTQTQTLTLKASGSTLTGTLQGARGEAVEITNGTIDGDSISFTVVREFRDNKITQEFKGSVSGSELKLTESGGRRGPMEVTYKRP
jgi:hypothetical protein